MPQGENVNQGKQLLWLLVDVQDICNLLRGDAVFAERYSFVIPINSYFSLNTMDSFVCNKIISDEDSVSYTKVYFFWIFIPIYCALFVLTAGPH